MTTITSVLIRVLAWSVVHRGIEPRSDKTKRHMKLSETHILNDSCLTPNELFVRYIMTRTSYN